LQVEQALLSQVVNTAKLAGQAILEVYNQPFTVAYKTDNSPLTAADKNANDIICKQLSQISDLPIVSEERQLPQFSERQQWDSYWIVDPLDGTREFIKKNGEFSVNIGLIHNHVPIFGVVLQPTTGQHYVAYQNQSYYSDSYHDELQPLPKLSFPKPKQKLRLIGSSSHGNPKLQQYVTRLTKNYRVVTATMGSSLKFCQLAHNKSDLYIRLGPTSEWDTAAAHAVLLAMGGEIYNLQDFAPIRYNTNANILNPAFVATCSTNIQIQDLLQ